MVKAEKRILLAIDFQNQSLLGFEYAVNIAKTTGCELHLLHVIEDGNFVARMVNSEEQKNRIIEESKKLMTNLINNVGSDVKIVPIIAEGKVYEQIEKIAETVKPHFIVMGKTEQSSLERKIVGSNSLHLIKEANYPVLTVRGVADETSKISDVKQILLPLDLSGEICEQITAAIDYGKFFNAEICVISILTKNSVGTEMQYLTKLSKVKSLLTEAGIRCNTELVKETVKPVHESIIGYAQKPEISMIIIMTQNESEIVKYFIGSTAQEVICASPKPVLSVIPWENKDQSIFNTFIDPLGILK